MRLSQYTSTKKIMASLNITREKALLIKRLLKIESENYTNDAREKIIAEMERSYKKQNINLDFDALTCVKYGYYGAELLLELFDIILDNCGTSAIHFDGHIDNYHFDILACYCNNGDTYQNTIIYDNENQVFTIESLGDFVEYKESQGYKFN